MRVSCFLFQLYCKNGASNTSVGNTHGVISEFPSFKLEAPSTPVGVLAYGNLFSGWVSLTVQKYVIQFLYERTPEIDFFAVIFISIS